MLLKDFGQAKWNRESTAINSLMAIIFQSLDRVSLAWFFEPLRNRYNRNPQNFFMVMNREYGVPDTEVISNWISSLSEPMVPNSTVRDLVSMHRDLHSKLGMARGYVINEDDAVRGLLQATKFSSLRPSVIQWLTEHRGAANQTFDNLAAYLCQIESVTESLAAPSTGPMYAALQANEIKLEVNATSTSPVVSNADILHAIQSLVLSSKVDSKSKVKTSPSKRDINAPLEYCWTHGHCGHTSAACKKPSEGHIVSATANNPAGGNLNTYKWVKPK